MSVCSEEGGNGKYKASISHVVVIEELVTMEPKSHREHITRNFLSIIFLYGSNIKQSV